MAYYTGDNPAEDLVIEPARNEEPIDLTLFTEASVALRDEQGQEVPTAGFLATIEDEAVIVEWPGGDLFETPGLYSLNLTLANPTTGTRERVAPVWIVVQGDDGWHTLDTARDLWHDAPQGDRELWEVLEVSKQAVLDFAPALPEGTRPPINYVKGQLMQARNVWNAAKVDSAGGGIGEDTFQIRPFPLDWMIKQILRPKSVVPVVG